MNHVSVAAILGIVSLAACSSSEPNPTQTFMNVGKDKQTITGRYDPSGSSRSDVFAYLRFICGNAKFGGYAEASEEHLMRFSARCTNASPYGKSAGATFAKINNTSAEGHVTFSNNAGQLAQQQVTLEL